MLSWVALEKTEGGEKEREDFCDCFHRRLLDAEYAGLIGRGVPHDT